MQRTLRSKARIHVFLAALGLLTILGASLLNAQLTTGKIEGYVRDTDTGSPLAGVQITVDGTRLGNITNSDGYYFILNVPPGLQTITAAFTGYQKTSVSDQRILAGQTMTVDFTLSSTVIEIEGIVVEGASEILVPRDNTVTKQRISSEAIEQLASQDLKSILELQAGVATGGEGGLSRELRIRGGRPGEEALIVDGIMVRNHTSDPLNGDDAQWWIDTQDNFQATSSIPLELASGSVEQVDIITGGWQAEYGNVQSGIINIVTKTGGQKLKGKVRMTSDELNPETATWGYNRLEFNMNGPLPLVKDLTFNVTTEMVGQDDMSPTHADEGYRGITQEFVDRLNKAVSNMTELGENPYTLEGFRTGYNNFRQLSQGDNKVLFYAPFENESETVLKENWGDKTLLSGKLHYSPISSLSLFTTANFSRNQRSYYEHGKLYNYGRIYPYLEENGNLRALGADSIRQINPHFAERLKAHNVLFGIDWTMFQSAEKSAQLQARYSHIYNTQVINSPLQRGYERSTTLGWSFDDIPFELEWYPNREIRMSDPDDLERVPDATALEEWNLPLISPFGFTSAEGGDAFGGDGYAIRYDFLQEQQDVLKFDFDFQWARQQRLKAGFEYTNISNFQFNIVGWSSVRTPEREYRYNPYMMGGYVQNRTDLGDFVMNYGVRFDKFDPQDNWGNQAQDIFGYYYFPKSFSSVSPRFDVGFPITDRSQLRLAYGRFSQLPSLNYILSSSNYGDLEYQVTESLEAGFTQMIADEWVLDLVTYYKDVLGNVSSRQFWRDYTFVDANSGDLRLNRGFSSGFTNRDVGNIKGLDVSLRKAFSNYYTINASYTLEFSRTTGSIPSDSDGTFDNYDPTTLETSLPPDELTVIDNDRTHRLNLIGTMLLPNNFMQHNDLLSKIFRNFSATGTIRLMSGSPYTRSSNLYSGINMTIGGSNFFRNRSYYSVDLKLSKKFDLGGGVRIEGFAEVYNLTNRKDHNTWSVSSIYDDLADTYEFGHPLTNLKYENATSFEQKMHFQSDYNGDGVLSINELVMGQLAQSFAGRGNPQYWGRPRQVRLGLELDF